jgi:hypothetical protein
VGNELLCCHWPGWALAALALFLTQCTRRRTRSLSGRGRSARAVGLLHNDVCKAYVVGVAPVRWMALELELASDADKPVPPGMRTQWPLLKAPQRDGSKWLQRLHVHVMATAHKSTQVSVLA